MTQRIREAMRRDPMASLLAGAVVADETWIGGSPKNKHGKGPGKGVTTKTPVLSLISVSTGEARSVVVPNVTGETLGPILRAQVDPSATVLHTDSSNAYKQVGPEMVRHETTNHFIGQYVGPTGSTTNPAEGFFSQLKRSIDGTHHHVSVEHLPRYLAEFDYRFTTREMTDGQRMQSLMFQTDRRLSYRPLTGGA